MLLRNLHQLSPEDEIHIVSKMKADARHLLEMCRLIDQLTCICGNPQCFNGNCLAVRRLRELAAAFVDTVDFPSA